MRQASHRANVFSSELAQISPGPSATENATTTPQAQASSAGKLQKSTARVEMMFVESFPVSNSKCIYLSFLGRLTFMNCDAMELRPSYMKTSAVEVVESASVSNSCQPTNVWKWVCLKTEVLPSGYVKIAIENGHRNSGFSQKKWRFSIAMLVYQRVPSKSWIKKTTASPWLFFGWHFQTHPHVQNNDFNV